jgi:hypothetical protein
MNKYFVYSYSYPNGTPYYIGKGSGRRHRVTLCDAKAGRNLEKYAVRVTRKILNNNELPIITKIASNLEEDVALQMEIELIAKYGRRDIGTGILTNCTDGGDRGAQGLSKENNQKRVRKFVEWTKNFRVVDEQYKKNISEGMKAYHAENPMSEEERKRRSILYSGENAPMYGKKHTQEALDKMSKAHKGIPLSEEHKKALSLASRGKRSGENNGFYGKNHSDETREKISEASRNTVKKLRESNKPHWNYGKILSEDHLAKLRVEKTCPHCGRTGRGSAMNRYHMDNCAKVVS